MQLVLGPSNFLNLHFWLIISHLYIIKSVNENVLFVFCLSEGTLEILISKLLYSNENFVLVGDMNDEKLAEIMFLSILLLHAF